MHGSIEWLSGARDQDHLSTRRGKDVIEAHRRSDRAEFSVNDIHHKEVRFPELHGQLTHLQFRRFAGCPICNLHLQSFVQRISEVQQAGIREVVVFHSTDQQLLPYQGNFPFQVIGDPTKSLYKKFGVGSSLAAVLSPGSWPASIKGDVCSRQAAHWFPAARWSTWTARRLSHRLRWPSEKTSNGETASTSLLAVPQSLIPLQIVEKRIHNKKS